MNVLKGDFRPVERLLWSPNGQLLITSDYSSTRIWDVASGRVLHEFEGEFGACNDDFTALWTHCEDTTKLWDIEGGKILQAVAATITSFSPNDRYVVVLGGPFKQKHRLYDTETKRVLALLPRGLFGRQYSWSPDSQKLAIKTGIDRCVWVWDCQTGEILQATQTKDSVADLLAWSPDGVLLAVATEDGAIHLWNAKDGQSSLLLEHCGTNASALSWSADSRFLATSFKDHKSVRLMECATGRTNQILIGHEDTVNAISWSPDARTLATGSDDTTCRLWDVKSGRCFRTLNGEEKWLYDPEPQWNADGSSLSLTNSRGDRENWGPLAAPTFEKVSGYGKNEFLAESPDGLRSAAIDWDGVARLSDLATGRTLHVLNEPGEPVEALSWSPDGRMVATISGQAVQIWDAGTGQALRALTGHRLVYRVAWSPDNRKILTASKDNTARLWDLQTGQVMYTFSDADRDVAWSIKGELIATATGGGYFNRVNLYDAATGQKLKTVNHDHPILSITMSPDCSTLAVGDLSSNITLFSCKTGEKLRALRANHRFGIRAMAWEPDGKILCATGGGGTTDLWDTQTGRKLATMARFRDESWAVVSPEGFFDGSPAGLKKLHWVLGMETAEVERFFIEFYQPGLLRDVMQLKKPVSEILEGRADPRSKMNISDKDRRAVRVEFRQRPDTRIAARSIELVLDIAEAPKDADHQSGSGIKDLKLFRNGNLVWRSPPGRALKGGRIVIPDVPVVAGENKYVAYAFNNDNIKSGDAELSLEGDESLAREPHAFILSIGVNVYENSKYNLKYAVSDARELSGELAANVPVPINNVHSVVVVDKFAKKKNILDAIDSIAKTAGPEDTVVVSFAGHGVKHDDHFYLVPHNMGPGGSSARLAAFGISDEELEEHLVPVQAARAVLIIDACYSGEALRAEEWRVGPMNSRGLPQLAWEKGIEILTASQSDQTAKELSELGHGLLTAALIKGLEEGPRVDGKGLLASDWLDFAAQKVPQYLGNSAGYIERFAISLEDRRVSPVQIPRVFHGRRTGSKWPISR